MGVVPKLLSDKNERGRPSVVVEGRSVASGHLEPVLSATPVSVTIGKYIFKLLITPLDA